MINNKSGFDKLIETKGVIGDYAKREIAHSLSDEVRAAINQNYGFETGILRVAMKLENVIRMIRIKLRMSRGRAFEQLEISDDNFDVEKGIKWILKTCLNFEGKVSEEDEAEMIKKLKLSQRDSIKFGNVPDLFKLVIKEILNDNMDLDKTVTELVDTGEPVSPVYVKMLLQIITEMEFPKWKHISSECQDNDNVFNNKEVEKYE